MEEDRHVLLKTLSSYSLYRQSLHAANQLRRTDYISLNDTHKSLIPDYLARLEEIDEAIARNAKLVEDMMYSGCLAMLEEEWTTSLRVMPGNGDMEKIRSTVRQVVRDWTEEGIDERNATYTPILQALQSEFLNNRDQIRVLTPGCGLGRLPFEIARLGFNSVGNEFSYHMLIASNYLLNHMTSIGQYQISPYAHSMSNHFSRSDMLRKVPVPDIVPADVLSNAQFSMAAGEFVECFGNAESENEFHAIVTCFFLDTAHNIVAYLETIRNLLCPGGYWINVGPCLWHHENGTDRHGKAAFDEVGDFVGSIELCMDEVMALAERLGFTIETKDTIMTSYMGNEKSMLTHTYTAQLFTARLTKHN